MGVMWPFKRKKITDKTSSGLACPHCGSKKIRLVSPAENEQPDYVKVWRGNRYTTCRCLDCGRDFYSGELPPELVERLLADEDIVSDEDELRAAEAELKRQVDEEGDHMFKSGM
jgi:DNA-directed RNA polymerase subunit RPC12/RpoP